MQVIRISAISCALAVALAGCVSAPPAQVNAPMPAQWQGQLAQLPHEGSIAQLLQWWQQWNDPLLVDLIAAAEKNSPDLASAAARVAQARAGAVGAQAAFLPSVNAQGGLQRTPASTQTLPAGVSIPSDTQLTIGQIGAQLQWELDVFGGARHANRAAVARLEAAQAQWHQARVSLAADTANQYFSWRACHTQQGILADDARSRADTARLTNLLKNAGFAAPATAALTDAGAAQSQAQSVQTQAQCQAALQGLSALTAIDTNTLNQRLQAPAGVAPTLTVDSVPGHVIAQRPDVYAAAQNVAAAAGDVGQADAQRYPRIALGANIARTGVQIADYNARLFETTWAIGPLSISVPLFDGGRRRANVQASKAQYEAAVSQYLASVRNAVREVETALNDLHAVQERETQVQKAVAGFEKAYKAANAKYRAGMGSWLELEDARRNYLQAQTTQVALQQQSQTAWVALYRALGGGWQASSNATQADNDMVRAGEAQRAATANHSEPMPAASQ